MGLSSLAGIRTTNAARILNVVEVRDKATTTFAVVCSTRMSLEDYFDTRLREALQLFGASSHRIS